MRLPFTGSHAINQRFNDPCCRDRYAQYGMNGHNGIDYNLPTGTPVVAVRAGSVYTAFEPKGYGNYLFLTDDSGNQFVYGHLQSYQVAAGRVAEGQVIAYSDNTGNSSGPHLHFGYRPKGYNSNNGFLGYEDPQPLFNGGGSMNDQQLAALADQRLEWLNGVGKEVSVPGPIDGNNIAKVITNIRRLYQIIDEKDAVIAGLQGDGMPLKPGKYVVK